MCKHRAKVSVASRTGIICESMSSNKLPPIEPHSIPLLFKYIGYPFVAQKSKSQLFCPSAGPP